MSSDDHDRSIIAPAADYDAVIVGASLAGCATAMLLGRAGARVALVEKQPSPQAFKRMCSHFIQASAVPTLERLGLLEPIAAAGGLRSRVRMWTAWGWIQAPPEEAGYAVNLRRELLDPLVRDAAAATPGVELILGRSAHDLVREDGVVRGVAVHDRNGEEAVLRAPLVVGADGRDSRVAELSGVPVKTLPHGRFAYGAYYEGPPPAGAPDGSAWMMDPQWAAAFPTDAGLTFYAAMPTKDRLPEFKRDPEAALEAFVADIPDAPPILDSRRVSAILGKLEMPNRVRQVAAPGLALVGDAALATDPLFGVGCGWAFQSAEWLADAVAPALRGEEALERGLARYRRRHARELRGHAFLIHDYATGRRFTAGERLLFAAAARDPQVAVAFDRLGTRRMRPARMFATTIPRALAVNVRHALGRHAGGAGSSAAPLSEAARA
jgi:2-polyprenyl-6-methoxyphenol hydroxylase-like FAD-dependent oxidoreductase